MLDRLIDNSKILLMPSFILLVGSMSKFLLWQNQKKKLTDFFVFVVFGMFLMIIVTYVMNILQHTIGFNDSIKENFMPLLYSFSALGSKEILEILIKKLPEEMSQKILGTLSVIGEEK